MKLSHAPRTLAIAFGLLAPFAAHAQVGVNPVEPASAGTAIVRSLPTSGMLSYELQRRWGPALATGLYAGGADAVCRSVAD